VRETESRGARRTHAAARGAWGFYSVSLSSEIFLGVKPVKGLCCFSASPPCHVPLPESYLQSYCKVSSSHLNQTCAPSKCGDNVVPTAFNEKKIYISGYIGSVLLTTFFLWWQSASSSPPHCTLLPRLSWNHYVLHLKLLIRKKESEPSRDSLKGYFHPFFCHLCYRVGTLCEVIFPSFPSCTEQNEHIKTKNPTRRLRLISNQLTRHL